MSLFDKDQKNKDAKIQGLKKEVAPGKTTAVAERTVDLDAMAADAGVELPEDFEGSLTPTVLKINILHPAGMFELPDDPENPVKTIRGIAVLYTTPNAYWEKDISENDRNVMPDCFSFNGIMPDSENPISANCGICDYNKFNSGPDGNGKMCKNKIRIFFLPDGANFPLMLSLSPTSIKAWREHITNLKHKKTKYYATVTEVGLEVNRSKPPYVFSVAKFNNIDIFDHYDGDNDAVTERIKLVLELIKMHREKFVTEKITAEEEGAGQESTDPY